MRRDAWDCRACGKKAFPSERRANGAIEHINTTSPRRRTPVRAYECPYGNGWHLTSKEYAA